MTKSIGTSTQITSKDLEILKARLAAGASSHTDRNRAVPKRDAKNSIRVAYVR